MEALQTLVRNLAVILLLATFLEMLLPQKSMQGFVKLVMGLFVISAILNPVTSFLHLPLEMEIPAWTRVDQQDMPVLAGNEGVRIGKNAVQEQYKLILTNEIKAIALGVSGVQQVDVEVVFDKTNEDLTEQPRLAEVRISLNSDKGEIESVKPVVIGGPEDKKEAGPSGKAEEVRDKVSALMQLPKDKIIVKLQ